MKSKNNKNHDIIDDDLYEEIEEEELHELVKEEQRKAIERSKNKEQSTKRPFPKWMFWVIAVAMTFNILAFFPQIISIPAIDFLQTSSTLSQNKDIQTYKEAVVVVETDDGRGTGFSITQQGKILTNEHVVEGYDSVVISFPELGLYEAEVIESYPEIDMAVLQTKNEEDVPYLTIDDQYQVSQDEGIRFIGNPLFFNGIANEGNIAGTVLLDNWDKEVVMIQAPEYRGNSGSPIINQAGDVVGVIFATLDHESKGKVGLYVPISYFTEL
ncbi:S1 family peptidase [Oceanobacillus kimchii]|uniref:S1 family peptidase n=1 Tax=Oceanobacillus kimchii TaxID=746691 RepID=UPI0009861C1B|nr:serine protease [Oceanobacillus kimchii]